MLSRSAWGRGQGARSQSSHLETTGRGENPSPCFLHCACPHSHAENALFSGGPTWPRTTQEIPEQFAPRRPGEPLPQPGSPGAAPPSPGHIQRLWSLGPCRAAPPALGTSESPPKPRIRSPHSAPIPNPAWLTRFPLPPVLQQPGTASSPSDLLLPARPSHLTCSPASAGIPLAPILENLIFLNQSSSFIWIHWSNNYYYSPFSCICDPTEHRNWVRSPEPSFGGKSGKKKKKKII